MKPHVLVTRRIFDESLATLARHCVVDSNQKDVPLSPRQLQQRLTGKDGVICLLTDRITDAVLASQPRLKIVSNVAVGFNNLDIASATKRGVMMTNTPGVLDDTTADFTWCLILAAARGLVDADRVFRSGTWKGWGLMQFLGHDVCGKTIGICGFGRIGRGVARRARGFDMRVLYTDVQRAPEAIEHELGATFVDKATLLRQSDIVTLHVPLVESTQHYIAAADLPADETHRHPDQCRPWTRGGRARACRRAQKRTHCRGRARCLRTRTQAGARPHAAAQCCPGAPHRQRLNRNPAEDVRHGGRKLSRRPHRQAAAESA